MVRAVVAHTVGAFAAFDKFVFVFDGIAVLAMGRFVVLFGLLPSFDVVVVLVHVRFLLCSFLPDESRRARRQAARLSLPVVSASRTRAWVRRAPACDAPGRAHDGTRPATRANRCMGSSSSTISLWRWGGWSVKRRRKVRGFGRVPLMSVVVETKVIYLLAYYLLVDWINNVWGMICLND